MPDLHALADLGRASVHALWLPLALWTALALAAEAGLRLARSRAALALPVRGAVLAALPLAVAVPVVLRALAPAAALSLAWAPQIQWLPGVVVGGGEVAGSGLAGPPALDVALGAAVLAAGLLSALHLVRLARSLADVAAARRRLAPADALAQRAVDDARQRLGVARPVAAVVAPDGAAPFTLGWRRPLVALPADLDDAACEVAALHEVAHVRRADFAWHVAQRVVTAAFAAHPLAWAVGRGLDLDRERAADAVVLDACPGRRRTYADLLFSYVSLPAPALALGTTGGSSSLKHRIDAMTSPLSPTRSRLLARWGRLGGFLTLALAAGLAATTAATVPDGTPTKQRRASQATPLVPDADASLATTRDTTDVYDVVDEMPELIGGLEGLVERLDYPELQRRAGVEGTTVIQFVVGADGGVEDAKVVRTAGNDGLDRAALQVVETARFQPGREGGRAVRTRFAVPITFRLPNSTTPSDSEVVRSRYPNTYLTQTGLDVSELEDPAMMERFLRSTYGPLIRQYAPDLSNGAQATIRVTLDDEGKADLGTLQVESSSEVFQDLSAFLAVPVHIPARAGEAIEFTVTYVKGDG